MKPFAASLSLLPGAAMAHGVHPPVNEAAHSGVHAMMMVGAAILLSALVGAVAWRARK